MLVSDREPFLAAPGLRSPLRGARNSSRFNLSISPSHSGGRDRQDDDPHRGGAACECQRSTEVLPRSTTRSVKAHSQRCLPVIRLSGRQRSRTAPCMRITTSVCEVGELLVSLSNRGCRLAGWVSLSLSAIWSINASTTCSRIPQRKAVDLPRVWLGLSLAIGPSVSGG